jgi:hypothetical protein
LSEEMSATLTVCRDGPAACLLDHLGLEGDDLALVGTALGVRVVSALAMFCATMSRRILLGEGARGDVYAGDEVHGLGSSATLPVMAILSCFRLLETTCVR